MKYSWKHRCDASPLLLQIDNGLAASPEPSFSVTERSKELIVLLMYDYVIPLNTLPLKRLRPPGLQIPNLKWSRGFLPLAPKQLSSNMSWTEIHREKVLWLFFFFFQGSHFKGFRTGSLQHMVYLRAEGWKRPHCGLLSSGSAEGHWFRQYLFLNLSLSSLTLAPEWARKPPPLQPQKDKIYGLFPLEMEKKWIIFLHDTLIIKPFHNLPAGAKATPVTSKPNSWTTAGYRARNYRWF